MTMALPLGTWNVVTNLHDSILSITNVDAAGNITGTIQIDASHTYNITGTWNAATNELKFSYSYTILFGHFHLFFFASYDGYVFQAGDPLFKQSAGPVSPAAWNMLAGTYTVGPFFEGITRPNYGWVARQPV
jgi:hypothetical protein